MLKVFSPDNIFTRLLAESLSVLTNAEISYYPAASISNKLQNDECDIAIIPSFDLLSHNEYFISEKFGISFTTGLSNSYLYFIPGKREINKLLISGDVSSNEIVISKILFMEKFEIELEPVLDSSPVKLFEENYLIAGDKNFETKFLKSGLSLADEITDQIEFPYVNFAVVSKNKKLLNFGENEPDEEKLYEKLQSILESKNLGVEAKSYINEQFYSVNFNLKNFSEALVELLRLPYYHGIVEELKELNFI